MQDEHLAKERTKMIHIQEVNTTDTELVRFLRDTRLVLLQARDAIDRGQNDPGSADAYIASTASRESINRQLQQWPVVTLTIGEIKTEENMKKAADFLEKLVGNQYEGSEPITISFDDATLNYQIYNKNFYAYGSSVLECLNDIKGAQQQNEFTNNARDTV